MKERLEMPGWVGAPLPGRPARRPRRPKGVTSEGLIPLSHLWYTSEHVVRDVCAALRMTPPEVHTRLNLYDESLARRWGEIHSGRQRYIRLPKLDAMLLVLGLNLHVDVGDPDIHSTLSPVEALRLGRTLTPPPEHELLAA